MRSSRVCLAYLGEVFVEFDQSDDFFISGIEYGTIRRLKLLEQEREVLQKGLQAVERAKDWYLRQISFLQEKLQARAPAHGAPVSDLFKIYARESKSA